MSDSRPRIAGIAFGIFLAASALTAIAALVVVVNRAPVRPPPPPREATTGMLIAADRPIPAEADVFRTHAGVLAIAPGTRREREAHPRTLVRFRFLRAYPGAPPRIPHGFTADEFRTGECNTCHERGGYSPRFSAYVPVTPHPDMPACLQCHVGSDAVTGVSLPSLDPSTICRQCHAPGAARWAEASVDWQPMAWPALSPPRGTSGVPPIAHDLFFRGNCLACHAGPSGVAELRTTHPERANCRQCHVAPEAAVEEYVRPTPALDISSEGR